MAQVSAMSVSQNTSDDTMRVLTAHEDLMQISRRFALDTIGALTTHLTRIGRPEQSRRVRAAARTRGAVAHPDNSSASEVEQALTAGNLDADEAEQEASVDWRTSWSPSLLEDDRALHRRQRNAGGSKAVKRLVDAAPPGGSDRASSTGLVAAPEAQMDLQHMLERLSGVER